MTDDELRVYIDKEIARREKGLARYLEYSQSDNPELRAGGVSFAKAYERELQVLRLAKKALD